MELSCQQETPDSPAPVSEETGGGLEVRRRGVNLISHLNINYSTQIWYSHHIYVEHLCRHTLPSISENVISSDFQCLMIITILTSDGFLCDISSDRLAGDLPSNQAVVVLFSLIWDVLRKWGSIRCWWRVIITTFLRGYIFFISLRPTYTHTSVSISPYYIKSIQKQFGQNIASSCRLRSFSQYHCWWWDQRLGEAHWTPFISVTQGDILLSLDI